MQWHFLSGRRISVSPRWLTRCGKMLLLLPPIVKSSIFTILFNCPTASGKVPVSSGRAGSTVHCEASFLAIPKFPMSAGQYTTDLSSQFQKSALTREHSSKILTPATFPLVTAITDCVLPWSLVPF